MARLRFTGGGKYGLRQKHAPYRGHVIWQDTGFSGRKSYTIDNSTSPRYETISDVKKAIDSQTVSNPSHRGTKKKLRKKTGFRGKMTGYKTEMRRMLATRRSRKHHVAVANPVAILFRSRAAAEAYARAHGARRYSIQKVKRAR